MTVVIAAVLLVTAGALSVGLPAQTLADHWSLAWSGLDVATASTALATAGLLARRDRRASLTAAAGAALLVLDAWFDVTTAATGSAFWLAATEAVLLELPLAALAVGVTVGLLRESPRPTASAPRAPSPVADRRHRSLQEETVSHRAATPHTPVDPRATGRRRTRWATAGLAAAAVAGTAIIAGCAPSTTDATSTTTSSSSGTSTSSNATSDSSGSWSPSSTSVSSSSASPSGHSQSS